jgi:hypothetical protein
MRLEGEWKRWRYDEAFVKLVPMKVAKAAAGDGASDRGLLQLSGR